ncbi:50S ribosomal protein L9 [Cryomorphaceae bacterium]|nr:50S ribosomal protein L9 [Cryomorphaceae bacterium]
MDIILKQDVENLGFKDDIVTVKPGYARNYLIPQGIGIMATPSAVKMLEETLRQRAHKEAKLIEDANKTAAALAEAEIVMKAKVAKGGTKLFGSVTASDLSAKLEEMGHNIDRKYIAITGGAAKALGNYEAVIRLHREVRANVSFEVAGE